MVSFNARECRKEKLAKLIECSFKEGDWFTVHDIERLWSKKWSLNLTPREIAKLLPTFSLYAERRPKFSYKFYRYDGQKPLYVRRTDPYENLKPRDDREEIL